MFKTATGVRPNRACLAATAFVVLSTTVAGATFGPRTTIGNNYQQWSNEEAPTAFNPSNCGGSFCHLLFQRIKGGQPMIVQHVGCSVRVGTNGNIFQAYLGTRKGQNVVERRTPLTPVRTTGGDWAINNPVMHLLKANEFPYIYFEAQGNTTWLISCSMSGRLTN